MKFVRAESLFADIRASFNSSNETQNTILARFKQARWLVLDDFGTGALTDFERRILLDLIDVRGNDRRPTIASTNLSLDEIADRFDTRVASRFSAFTQVTFRSSDRRKQLRKPQ